MPWKTLERSLRLKVWWDLAGVGSSSVVMVLYMAVVEWTN